jgi:hypothetical protein
MLRLGMEREGTSKEATKMKCKECGRKLGTWKGEKICTGLFCRLYGKNQLKEDA